MYSSSLISFSLSNFIEHIQNKTNAHKYTFMNIKPDTTHFKKKRNTAKVEIREFAEKKKLKSNFVEHFVCDTKPEKFGFDDVAPDPTRSRNRVDPDNVKPRELTERKNIGSDFVEHLANDTEPDNFGFDDMAVDLTGLGKSGDPDNVKMREFLEQKNIDSNFAERLACDTENDNFGFDDVAVDLTRLSNSGYDEKVEVRELAEFPEEWRRTKLAWLCKELPGHKHTSLVRLLNAQRKWVRQEDATYVAVHCMRIRENETGFRVYKWMINQHWFRFDFALATKLADFMGKERKYSKCREIFDDILNQGRVPTDFTFHVLIVAYLSSNGENCIEQACDIYNRMILLGCYNPRLSLHNSLFKSLVSKPGGSSKHYLKHAEFIFHNLVTSGFEIHKDIYGGLIWLHSYQDTVDTDRIAFLRSEMKLLRIGESKEVLLSILRACSKSGNVIEAEKTWLKLNFADGSLPSKAFVYRMQTYAKSGQILKSLEIFREMKDRLGSPSVAAYHKIIEVLCKSQEKQLAESLMEEFMESDLKPLMPSFIDMMDMYLSLDLHGKLEFTFLKSVEKGRPNRTIYTMYLDSLVKVGNIEKAEGVFNEMLNNEAIGVNTRSSNTILRGYLSNGDYEKAVKIYYVMSQKKYDIEPLLTEKVIQVLRSRKKVGKKPATLNLNKDQREILVGLLLGGLRVEADESGKKHIISFEFNEKLQTHNVLKSYIHKQFLEWLASPIEPNYGTDDIPSKFRTIPHNYFSFYAEQFWPLGQPEVPKLIHRWLSPTALAYWYSFGGYKTSTGDILLKLRGSDEGIERIARALKAKSLEFRVKKKGRVFWIGFLESNATSFWAMVKPYILDDLRDCLEAGRKSVDNEF